MNKLFLDIGELVFPISTGQHQPFLTPKCFKRYYGRVSELEAEYLLILLFAMGRLAVWWEAKRCFQPKSSEWISSQVNGIHRRASECATERLM